MKEDEDVAAWSSTWADFRRAVAAGPRESLASVAARASSDFRFEDWGAEGGGSPSEKSQGSIHQHAAPRLGAAYQGLTEKERCDLLEWQARLAREKVFGRFYFPEPWEVRELETIRTFLELERPSDARAPGASNQERAVASIFFPGDFDPKSVLLKRGPVLVDGVEERELLLFTHGFVLSRITFDMMMHLLATRKPLGRNYSHKGSFNSIDTDGSGAIDRSEISQALSQMDVVVSEYTVENIMERFDANHDGKVSYEEFEKAVQDLQSRSGSGRWSYLSGAGKKFKRLASGMGSAADGKLAGAYEYVDIERVESFHASYSEANAAFATSSWAEQVFAIHLKGQEDPLVIVCAKPEQRLAWVDALHTCYVGSTQSKTNSELRSANERIAALEEELQNQEEQTKRELATVDETIKAKLDDIYARVAKCLEKKDVEIAELKRKVGTGY